MRRRKIAAALVAALVLASCGGGDKTEVVSRAEAVKRLEAACLAGTRAARAELQGTSDQTRLLFGFRKNLETIMERIRDVEIAGAAKADLDAYKQTVEIRLDTLAKITAADRSEWRRLIAARQSSIAAASARAHEAIVGLGARHVCI